MWKLASATAEWEDDGWWAQNQLFGSLFYLDIANHKNGSIGGWCHNTVIESLQCMATNSRCSNATNTCVCLEGHELAEEDDDKESKQDNCVKIKEKNESRNNTASSPPRRVGEFGELGQNDHLSGTFPLIKAQ